MPATSLILMRHAESTANALGLWQGQLDFPLSEAGRQQADNAARELAGRGVQLVASSDLERARTTAAAAAKACRCDLRLDARLREMHVGEWEGLSTSSVSTEYPDAWRRMISGEDIARGETGETIAIAQERLVPAIHDVIHSLPAGGTALVVSHGASITAILASLLEVDYRRLRTLIGGLRNAHWAEVDLLEEGSVLRGWNIGAVARDAHSEIQH